MLTPFYADAWILRLKSDAAVPREENLVTTEPPVLKNLSDRELLAKFKQMHEILSQIIMLESLDYDGSGLPPRNSKSIKKMVEWVRGKGATGEMVSVTKYDHVNYGLCANQDIEIGDSVLKIPRCVMITIEDAKSSKLKCIYEECEILKSMSNVALALFVLYEKFKEAESFWAPYLDSLPNQHSTILYFTPEEMEKMRISPALEPAVNLFRSITRQYACFKLTFENRDDGIYKVMRKMFTYERYRWAVSTVMTRQNTMPSKDHDYLVNALIPFWDMCNHAEIDGPTEPEVTSHYLAGEECLEMVAMHQVPKGHQLFMYYGHRSNAEFMINNAFVSMCNKHDMYTLRMGNQVTHPLHPLRSQLLESIQLSAQTSDYQLSLCKASPLQPKLIAFTRVIKMSEDQLTEMLAAENKMDLMYSQLFHHDFGTKLDEQVLEYLQARIAMLLKRYPPSNMKNYTLDSQIVLLIDLLLIAESKVLQNALDFIRNTLLQAKMEASSVDDKIQTERRVAYDPFATFPKMK